MAASLTETAIEKVRELIVAGRLLPGERSRPKPTLPRPWGPAATRCGRRYERWSALVSWRFDAATAPSSRACGPSCCSPESARRPISFSTTSRWNWCRFAASSNRLPPGPLRVESPTTSSPNSTPSYMGCLPQILRGARRVRRGLPPRRGVSRRQRNAGLDAQRSVQPDHPRPRLAWRARGRGDRSDDLRACRDPCRIACARPAARRSRRLAPRVDHGAMVRQPDRHSPGAAGRGTVTVTTNQADLERSRARGSRRRSAATHR